ncbi:hypothetical protein EDI_336590 [Entamoeba dispar SAW760]|uniref:Importin subunit alpha n=1 Tax=Entamoeba dispar (strain ATCC PRA-260 / SAW760) TaxID=370354 RepID=B0ERW4_ENTDS|nr:uncharacterized protein EDI_336590 [Entamoeba dispar SAW760]EDR22759.1 hypothetical protein EDI_336590 [Entamoeba dispar SAW760]|eukprot:EDR22759.1 hypothetical protein EDI_336590 [Entamoeba dispar SAW760]
MSFRHFGDASDVLRTKKIERSNKRTNRREMFLSQKRILDETDDTIPQTTTISLETLKQYTSLAADFYGRLKQAFESQNEELINQVISEIAKMTSTQSTCIDVFSVQVIPLLLQQTLQFFYPPFIDKIHEQDDRVFIRIAEILSDASGRTPDVIQEMMNNKLIEVINKLLNEQEEVVGTLLYCVGNISIYPNCASELIESGIFGVIQHLSEYPPTSELFINASWIFSVICRSLKVECPLLIPQFSLIPKFLKSGNEQVVLDILNCSAFLGKNQFYYDYLSLLSIESFCLIILKRSIIEPLIASALAYISCYVFYSSDTSKHLEILKAILPLRNQKSPKVKKLVYLIMSNLIYYNEQDVNKLFIENNIFDIVSRIVVSTEKPQVKHEAAWVLCNGLLVFNNYQYFAQDSICVAILSILSWESPKLVNSILRGVQYLIKDDLSSTKPIITECLIENGILDLLNVLLNSGDTNLSHSAEDIINLLQNQVIE